MLLCLCSPSIGFTETVQASIRTRNSIRIRTTKKEPVMFSEHLQTRQGRNFRPLLLAAGAALIVCQLGAMAFLASGQVAKAEVRDSAMQQQRIAIAQCFENTLGAARRNCLPQAQAAGQGTLAGNDVAASPARGLMAVSFGSN